MFSSQTVPSLREDVDYVGNSKNWAPRTPGRTLKGRAGLQENMLHNGAMTAHPKEKKVTLKTPFNQGTKLENKGVPPSSKPTILFASRPLMDKTPLPNRVNTSLLITPNLRSGNNAKFPLHALLDEQQAETPSQPPSSSRKKLRVPRSSSKSFETPITNGDHWNVSDISIEVGGSSLDSVTEDDINEPDYSDVEYAPPTAILPPYEPPFELPNYKEVGEALRTLAHSYPVNNSTSRFDEVDTDELLREGGWSSSSVLHDFHLPDFDDDDIFAPVTAKTKSITNPVRKPGLKASVTSRLDIPPRSATVTKTFSVAQKQPLPPPRPATSTSITTSKRTGTITTTMSSTIPRPVTSASIRGRSITASTRAPEANGAKKTLGRPPASQNKKLSLNDVLLLRFDDVQAVSADDDFRFAL